MKKPLIVTLPTLAAIAATRGMLGAGIGLLASARVAPSHRRRVGRVLVGIGLLSTVPLLRRVFRGAREAEPRQLPLRSIR
ncbi:MAG TPA: hypothetical protein VFO19_17905 [Vicinamibacterales bacterium]|nr:hypothetical protein [Vicinamibacterales bacterium]